LVALARNDNFDCVNDQLLMAQAQLEKLAPGRRVQPRAWKSCCHFG
jgi:hypothetical protein